MTAKIETNEETEVVELSPSYKLPIAIVAIALPLAWANVWIGGAVALFGIFLIVQTIFIRLRFTPTTLDVCRSGAVIRSFPYSEWLNWEIFFSPVPILFYFREVNSIHFLPIIFSSKTLADCLAKYCPKE